MPAAPRVDDFEARGEFPRDHHGDRARDDKYLELFGIMPTLGLLRVSAVGAM